MTQLPAAHFIVLLLLTGGCTRANVVPMAAPLDDAAVAVDAPEMEVLTIDSPDAMVDGPLLCPLVPMPSCQTLDPAPSPCDPVCQTLQDGCGNVCGVKCSYSSLGKALCATAGIKDTLESCDTSDQGDTCIAGDICLATNSDGTGRKCFALCRNSADCRGPGIGCAARLVSSAPSVYVCDPLYRPCSPDYAGTSEACCDPLDPSSASYSCPQGQFCYLVAPEPYSPQPPPLSRTVCEFSTGYINPTQSTTCVSSRDCMEKSVCVDRDRQCHAVCNLASPACPSYAPFCTPYGSTYGYCSPSPPSSP